MLVELPLGEEVLQIYRAALGFPGPGEALRVLAEVVAGAPFWCDLPPCTLLLRQSPEPRLAVFGWLDSAAHERIAAQFRALVAGLRRFRYIGYPEVDRWVAALAGALQQTLGEETLRRCRFEGLPRGGLMVLGMLAYHLDLPREHFSARRASGEVTVVVDDCALTGARFGSWLRDNTGDPVVFAHLASPAPLRTAIQSQEPRVRHCIAAMDLPNRGEALGPEETDWRAEWQNRLTGPRYWIGLTDHVCFPWTETVRMLLDPVTNTICPAWKLVPAEKCLGNRATPGSRGIPVQFVPAGEGELRPGDAVLYGELDGFLVAADLATGRQTGLADTSAEFWKAVIETGSPGEALERLREVYAVSADTLEADLHAWIDRLCDLGFLVRHDVS